MDEIREESIEQHEPALKVIDTPRLHKGDDARTFLKILTRDAVIPDNAVLLSQTDPDTLCTKYRIVWQEDGRSIDPSSYESDATESCNFKDWLNQH